MKKHTNIKEKSKCSGWLVNNRRLCCKKKLTWKCAVWNESLWSTSNCARNFQFKTHLIVACLLTLACPDHIKDSRSDPLRPLYLVLFHSSHPIIMLKKTRRCVKKILPLLQHSHIYYWHTLVQMVWPIKSNKTHMKAKKAVRKDTCQDFYSNLARLWCLLSYK